MFTIRYILTLLIALGMIACSKQKPNWTEREIAASDRAALAAHGNIDSLYIAYLNTKGRAATRLANTIFTRMDENGLTNDPLAFNPNADKALVRAWVDYWMAEYLVDEGRWDDAIEQCNAAIQSAHNINDGQIEGDAWSLLALSKQRKGDLHGALLATQECYKLNQELQNKEALSSDLNNLAFISLALGEKERARSYIDRAIEVETSLKRKDTGPLAIRYGTASEVYMRLGLLQRAVEYARKALALDSIANRCDKVGIRRSQLASALIEKGDTTQAAHQLRTALPVLREEGILRSQAICLNQLADIKLNNGQNSEANDLYLQAWRITMQCGDNQQRLRATRGLWHSTDDKIWIERYALLTDSINKITVDHEMKLMQAGFENRELELQNEHLSDINRLHLWLGITIIGLLTAVIVLLVVMRSNHIKISKERARVNNLRDDFFNHLYHKMRNPLTVISNLGHQLANEARTAEKGGVIASQADALLNSMAEMMIDEPSQLVELDKKDQEKQNFVNQLVDKIQVLMRTSQCTVEALAGQMCMTPSQLNRRVRECCNDTASQYMMRVRLERARLLLKSDPNMTIGDVANNCGFDDIAHFSRVFKKFNGQSPTQYRNSPT
ncbi:MAG: helix-turn-helix domain-containing protein [Bacteroidales bacterium]|nr:helix-turn-helix domain-containing protein [Bacteroidales bacterium]